MKIGDNVTVENATFTDITKEFFDTCSPEDKKTLFGAAKLAFRLFSERDGICIKIEIIATYEGALFKMLVADGEVTVLPTIQLAPDTDTLN
jgi:hypothetical protein